MFIILTFSQLSSPIEYVSSHDRDVDSDDNGLLVYWPMDEGEGDIAFNENAEYGHLSIICNGTSCPDDRWIRGHRGSALHFDGNSAYGTTDVTQDMDLSRFTFAFWVRADSQSGHSKQTIAQVRAPGEGIGSGWTMRITEEMKLEVLFYDGSTYTARLNGPLPMDQWMFIAVTYDGIRSALYLGDKLVASDHDTTLQPANEPLYVASFEGSSRFMSGRLDDLRLYDRSLSIEEVQQLFYDQGRNE